MGVLTTIHTGVGIMAGWRRYDIDYWNVIVGDCVERQVGERL
jgi:hypothetical protein